VAFPQVTLFSFHFYQRHSEKIFEVDISLPGQVFRLKYVFSRSLGSDLIDTTFGQKFNPGL